MARRHHLARWAAVACLATVASLAFAPDAEAEQLRLKAQLPALPVDLPVVLPGEVGLTPPSPLPQVWLGLPPTGEGPVTTATPAPLLPAPPPPAPTAPSVAPVAVPPATPAAAITPVGGLVPAGGSGKVGDWERRRTPIGALALPLGLIAALVAFLAVQAFVDRRDPKLAVAPMDDEVFSFR